MSARPPDPDRGSITPLVPFLILAFLLLGGLVIDAGRDLNARSDAQAYAEEAARAGAGAIDPNSGVLTLDPAEVNRRVDEYCAEVMRSNSAVTGCSIDRSLGRGGITSDVTCDGKRSDIVVNTVVSVKIATTLLGIVGLTELDNTVHAKARPYEGVTAGTAC